MRQRLLAGLVLLGIASTSVTAAALAQAAPTPSDSGMVRTAGIMRVTLFRLADGASMADVNRDITTHLVPVWEAQKKAGIIVNYATLTNTVRDSEHDWEFGVSITYANWAALDNLGARTNEITLKHYGTAEARTAANDARNKLRVQVSSQLIGVAWFAPAR